MNSGMGMKNSPSIPTTCGRRGAASCGGGGGGGGWQRSARWPLLASDRAPRQPSRPAGQHHRLHSPGPAQQAGTTACQLTEKLNNMNASEKMSTWILATVSSWMTMLPVMKKNMLNTAKPMYAYMTLRHCGGQAQARRRRNTRLRSRACWLGAGARDRSGRRGGLGALRRAGRRAGGALRAGLCQRRGCGLDTCRARARQWRRRAQRVSWLAGGRAGWRCAPRT
jgi:hypothetical protein